VSDSSATPESLLEQMEHLILLLNRICRVARHANCLSRETANRLNSLGRMSR
jgi:hypothetical protein